MFKTKEIILIGLFAALTAIGAFLSLPNPLAPAVPFTLQPLMVMLAGIMLGAKGGMLSQLVYMLLGLAGLPVFAGFMGGVGSIFRPSFGYIIGFIFAAGAIGHLSKDSLSFGRVLLAALAGLFVIYLFGVPYLYVILNFVVGKTVSLATALKIGLLIYLPWDIIKALLAVAIGLVIRKRVTG